MSESPHEDLSNDAQNVSKQSVLIEISVNQCPADRQIFREPPNVDVCFHVHMEALFNTLLTTINRPKGDKILWRYKDLKVWHDTDLLPIDAHQSLNTTRTAPYMVKLSLF